MQFLHTTEDRLLDELKEISNKLSQGEEMSAQCLDNIKDIAVALNQFSTYEAMKNTGYSQAGYSNTGYSNNGYSNNGYSNNDGYSNARGNQSRMSSRGMYNMRDGMREGRSTHGDWYPDDMSYRMRPEMY